MVAKIALLDLDLLFEGKIFENFYIFATVRASENGCETFGDHDTIEWCHLLKL